MIVVTKITILYLKRLKMLKKPALYTHKGRADISNIPRKRRHSKRVDAETKGDYALVAFGASLVCSSLIYQTFLNDAQ